MSYTKLTTTDLVVGANHPRYSDTKNRACQELYALLEAEHTDGVHDERARTLAGEILTFSGDGNSSKTITLSNSDLDPKFAVCWEARPGTDLVTNGGFDSISGWMPTDCTLASVAGGESGNCCELTRTGGTKQWFTQDITTIVNHRYRFTLYVKSGTSGDEQGYFGLSGGASQSFTTSGSWVQYTVEFVASSTTSTLLITKDTATAGTMLFDTAVVREMLTPSDPFRLDTFNAGTGAKGRHDPVITGVNITTGHIENFDTGEIQVSATGGAINTNGRTNYCLVLGIIAASATYTQGGGGSDPDWVEDGDAGYGDGTGTSVANQVEDDINTAFEAEHNGTTGVHTTDPYAKGKIETGTWQGTNGNDVITLSNATLDIKEGFYFKNGGIFYSVSESMSTGDSKQENAAAFSTNGFQSIGTGTFTAKTIDTNTYYYLVIGE